MKTSAFLLLFAASCYPQCMGEPTYSIDSLPDGKIAVQFDYKMAMGEAIAKYMDFTDTLSNEFLYKWVGDLFHKNAYVFHGVVDSAQTQWDTLIAERDTTIGITDVAYLITKGQKISKATFTTRFSVLDNYKGEMAAGHLTFKQVALYPEIERVISAKNFNPYFAIVGAEFLFFGNRLDQVPVTGPIPNNDCQYSNGFYIDKLKRVRKLGRIQTELNAEKKTHLSTELNTGVPGLSIPFDSLVWALTSDVRSKEMPAKQGTKGISSHTYDENAWLMKTRSRLFNVQGRDLPRTFPSRKDFPLP